MKMKKIVSILSTAAILTISIAGNTFAAGITFKDLDNVTAKDKIIVLQNQGVIAGVADGIFSPDNKVTAAQSIQLFVRAFNLNLDTIRFVKEPKATDYYKNAKDNAWYSKALIISAVNGMNFTADIDPDQNLTKEEYIYHLVNATEIYGQLPLIKIIPVEIADRDKMTIEYSGAIERALKYGIVKLDADGKFNPKAELSRADAAEQLYNALEYLKAHPAPSAAQSSIPETTKK